MVGKCVWCQAKMPDDAGICLACAGRALETIRPQCSVKLSFRIEVLPQNQSPLKNSVENSEKV